MQGRDYIKEVSKTCWKDHSLATFSKNWNARTSEWNTAEALARAVESKNEYIIFRFDWLQNILHYCQQFCCLCLFYTEQIDPDEDNNDKDFDKDLAFVTPKESKDSKFDNDISNNELSHLEAK